MPRTNPDYTYRFDGITDRLNDSRLHIHDHRTGQTHTIHVAVDDRDFLRIRGHQVPSNIADLIDLAVCIFEADRWSKREDDASCKILVQLHVRNPEVFNTVETHELLSQLLYWHTGDVWEFEFSEFDKQRRYAELQMPLWTIPEHEVPVEVALCSGGLDLLAGLCARIVQHSAQRYLLFGAGGNVGVRGVQQRVVEALKRKLPRVDISLTQLAIKQSGTQHLQRDPHLRTRGLVFILLGAAFAALEGQHVLMIYENGIGALNLPFRASEVGLDHARGVHPISLQSLSTLVSRLLAREVVFQNPFIWWTKAEMCRALKQLGVVDIVWLTTSCDKRHRKQTTECGRCSSCLLRRQALLAAGITDRTEYLVHTERGETLARLLRTSHLPAMQFQVGRLRHQLNQPNAWEILARQHPSLLADLVDRISFATGEAPEELVKNILMLLGTYIDEWSVGDVRRIFTSEMEEIRIVPRRVDNAQVVLE